MEYSGERLIIGNQECAENSDIYKEHVKRYEFALKFVENKKILDIACGSGYGSEMLARAGAQEVWAGDINEEAVKTAKEKYSYENLHFRVMDATELPFDDNYFDLAVSFETIEHVENYIEFAKELKRVLKAEGKLILSTPNKRITKKLGIENKFHIKEFDKKELINLLKSDFKLEFFGQRPVGEVKKLLLAYRIYKKIKILKFLDKIFSRRIKENIGKKIESLEKDFKVREAEEGVEYLYIIILGIKN